MERKQYLIAGVKPSLRRKWINEKKDNQSDFKEINEYANPRTKTTSNLLSSEQRRKVVIRPTGKVPQNNLNESS